VTASSRLSPEAKAAAQEIARGFRFSSEQKQLIADLMTPLLERWAAEQVPVKRRKEAA
jgi:hypothetical protein